MKTTLALMALFFLVLYGGYALYGRNHPLPTPASTTVSTPSNSASQPSSGKTGSGTSGGTAPSTNPGAYTSAQVAVHNTNSSCWTSINGNVYDLTSWIAQHPGGEGAILSICGSDGSAAFNAQHGGSRQPQQILASFKIGTLAS